MGSLREAGEKAGINGVVLDKMEALIQTDAVKEKLKQRTQEALDLGVGWHLHVKIGLLPWHYVELVDVHAAVIFILECLKKKVFTRFFVPCLYRSMFCCSLYVCVFV